MAIFHIKMVATPPAIKTVLHKMTKWIILEVCWYLVSNIIK